MMGSTKDLIVLASDSGGMALLEYMDPSRGFVAVQKHEFGRSGLRRLVAGQYVAADPRGRAVMLAAVERSKLVYIVTRDSEGRVVLASPLEASRSGSVCFDVVGVDVGYENPVFAAIESEYEESGKQVVYYELDLGLNHVVRKWSAAVGESAHRLIALPGGSDGPSGVLVCLEGRIEYKHSSSDRELSVAIPRSKESSGELPMVVASAVHRMKKAFFILAQTEDGDLFKITVDFTQDSSSGGVTRLGIKYFDTLAVGASSIQILKAGFLFAAAGGGSGGSHQLLQFENLGSDDDGESGSAPFERHEELQSLALVDEIEGACPLLRSQVLHVAAGEDAPQLYAACGSGRQSSLKIMRQGADVAELAVTELPAAPSGVWALGGGDSDGDLIVASFASSTLVLQGADEMAEAEDGRGLALDEPTLAVAAVDGGGLVQVTRRAVRHVRADGRVTEWAAGGEITCAALNARQAVVAVGAQAVCFALDERLELREQTRLETGGPAITCVALAPIAAGRLAAALAALGCGDQTVRVFVLGSSEPSSLLAVAGEPQSVAWATHGSADQLLYVGVASGLLVRVSVDASSGDVGDSRTRFVGSGSVRVCAGADGAVLALVGGSAPWISDSVRGRVQATRLSYDPLDFAAPLPSGGGGGSTLVCVAGAELRLVSVARLSESPALTSASIPLAHTPRAFCVHAESRFFAVIESDTGGSLVRVVSPFDGATASVDQLAPGDSALCMAGGVRFAGDPDQHDYVAVGCAQGLQIKGGRSERASVRLYR
ncbi:pre-mRNA-splicing factor rse1, partial [Coemansia aciculifera]